MTRTKKLFYSPGIISLIGLLVIFPAFYNKNVSPKTGCLTAYMVSDCTDADRFMPRYSKCYLEKEIHNKRQIKFKLNEKEDKKKLGIIRYEALKLKYTEDNSAVVLIYLNDGIYYGDFVALIDMCEYDEHKRYAWWDNKFVIFGELPPKKKDTSSLLRSWSSDLIIVPKPVIVPTLFELLKTRINKYYTPKGMYLFLGWIALLISSLYFRKRRISIAKTQN